MQLPFTLGHSQKFPRSLKTGHLEASTFRREETPEFDSLLSLETRLTPLFVYCWY